MRLTKQLWEDLLSKHENTSVRHEPDQGNPTFSCQQNIPCSFSVSIWLKWWDCKIHWMLLKSNWNKKSIFFKLNNINADVAVYLCDIGIRLSKQSFCSHSKGWYSTTLVLFYTSTVLSGWFQSHIMWYKRITENN